MKSGYTTGSLLFIVILLILVAAQYADRTDRNNRDAQIVDATFDAIIRGVENQPSGRTFTRDELVQALRESKRNVVLIPNRKK